MSVNTFLPYTQPPVSHVRENFADLCLINDYNTMVMIEKAGGLKGLCCPASYSGPNPPWTVMPPEGVRFQQINSVNLTAITEGVETVILSFRVPTGYDGVIVGLFNIASTTTPLVEGSRDASWRIKINNYFLKNYGNIQTTIGSLASPSTLYRGGVRVYSNQLIQYTVNLASGAKARLGTGSIICGLLGWWYPE
jgi:hypothetical protein